jgi:hypothetical protein
MPSRLRGPLRYDVLLMAAVAASLPSLERATFALAGRTLAIEAHDAAVAHILNTTYADARVSAMKGADHSAALRRLNDGRLHVRFDRRVLATGDAGSQVQLLSAYYAVKEVFARFAASRPHSLAYYGALVAWQDAAVLVLGPTGIGKTLFALHLAEQGAGFLGDETAVLDLQSSSVSALARKPALRETALTLLPSARMQTSVEAARHWLQTDRGRFWYALSRDELCGIAASDRVHRLGAVCIIRQRAQTFAMQRIDLDEALPALAQRAYARPSQLAQLSRLQHAMRRVPQYEVTLGEPRVSAAQFLEQVRTCA